MACDEKAILAFAHAMYKTIVPKDKRNDVDSAKLADILRSAFHTIPPEQQEGRDDHQLAHSFYRRFAAMQKNDPALGQFRVPRHNSPSSKANIRRFAQVEREIRALTRQASSPPSKSPPFDPQTQRKCLRCGRYIDRFGECRNAHPPLSPEEIKQRLDHASIPPGLPIEPYIDAIVASPHALVVVNAETGSGKTIRLPLEYAKAGYFAVVLEPLRVPTTSAANFLSDCVGDEVGGIVGYAIGGGGNIRMGPDTRIVYATYGMLEAIKDRLPRGVPVVVICDEMHERSVVQEVTEAVLYRESESEDPWFKQRVIMSATLAEGAFARPDSESFTVPGRTYPIETVPRGEDMVGDILREAKDGNDVLVFVAGKGQIEALQRQVQLHAGNATVAVHGIHGEMDKADIEQALAPSAHPRIWIATNAVQTGLTIVPGDGRNLTVVDTGLVNVMTVEGNGVRALRTKPASRAEMKQRKGRAGRTGPGRYIDWSREDDERTDHPLREMDRADLAQTYLEYLERGIDIRTLPFFAPLDLGRVDFAIRRLQLYGALDANEAMTNIGRRMASIPLDPSLARSMIAAMDTDQGCTDDDLLMFALINHEGILDRQGKQGAAREVYRERGIPSNDLERDMWILQAILDQRVPRSEFRTLGIHGKRVDDVRRTFAQLRRVSAQHRANLPDHRSAVPRGQAPEHPAPSADLRSRQATILLAGMLDRVVEHKPSGRRGTSVVFPMSGDPEKHYSLTRESVHQVKPGTVAIAMPITIQGDGGVTSLATYAIPIANGDFIAHMRERGATIVPDRGGVRVDWTSPLDTTQTMRSLWLSSPESA